MWPFSRKSALETELKELYGAMIVATGFTNGQAKEIVGLLLSVAKKKADTSIPRFGDRLLELEATDSAARETISKKRAEGVTDADIRWWWNLDRLERGMMTAFDDWMRMAAYKKYRAEGLAEEAAATKLCKSFPIFGDPDSPGLATGDDRPLPFELKDRINQWAERHVSQIASSIQSASSMNALIRSHIRAGNL